MSAGAGTAVVIGGSGFLGRHVCRELIAAGREVVSVDPSPPVEGPWRHCRPEDLGSVVDGCAQVFLVAAWIPYGALDRFSAELARVNVGLPLEVMARFGAARLIYASSVAVYGTPQVLPITEDAPFARPSAYALSKLAGETVVRAHPDAVVLRLSSLYGPGMTPRSFLPAIVRQAREAHRITLFGNGSRLQDYLHVRDAARMLLASAAGAATGVFNCVSGAPVSNQAVAGEVAALLHGVEIVLTGEDPTPSGAYSDARWRAAFGDVARTPLREGLRELIDHA